MGSLIDWKTLEEKLYVPAAQVARRTAAVAFENVKLKLAYPEDILKITKLTILK